nr:hypothetical protein [Halomonas sp.]
MTLVRSYTPALDGQCIHLRRKALVFISSISLGVVHGHVGVVHEGIDIVGIVRVEADADTQRDAKHMPLDVVWLAEHDKEFFCDTAGILGRSDLGEQDHELVTPLAADGIDVAHAAPKTVCHFLEQAVTHRMAKLVIDGFEGIKVEVEQGDHMSVSSGQANGS